MRTWFENGILCFNVFCISVIHYLNSAAAKIYFFKCIQPAVRHRLTYIKTFVLTFSLRKPVLTSWHFGAGGDILGQKHAFSTEKCEKMGLHYKTVEIHQWVVILRGTACFGLFLFY